MRRVAYEDEEDGDHHQSHEGADAHPPEDAGADGALAGGTGAAGEVERHDAEDEGERGHDYRAEAQVGGGERSLDAGFAAFLQVFGELDDEDGVFRHQPHHRDHADAEVDVVGEGFRPLPCHHDVKEVAAVDAARGAEQAERDDEDDGKRD